jgi:TRAP-type C4-dicarboxylate transport system substrate-binding protein
MEANRTWQGKVAKTGLEALEKTGIKIVRSTPQELAEFAKLVRPLYPKVVGPEVAEQFVKAADAQR